MKAVHTFQDWVSAWSHLLVNELQVRPLVIVDPNVAARDVVEELLYKCKLKHVTVYSGRAKELNWWVHIHFKFKVFNPLAYRQNVQKYTHYSNVATGYGDLTDVNCTMGTTKDLAEKLLPPWLATGKTCNVEAHEHKIHFTFFEEEIVCELRIFNSFQITNFLQFLPLLGWDDDLESSFPTVSGKQKGSSAQVGALKASCQKTNINTIIPQLANKHQSMWHKSVAPVYVHDPPMDEFWFEYATANVDDDAEEISFSPYHMLHFDLKSRCQTLCQQQVSDLVPDFCL